MLYCSFLAVRNAGSSKNNFPTLSTICIFSFALLFAPFSHTSLGAPQHLAGVPMRLSLCLTKWCCDAFLPEGGDRVPLNLRPALHTLRRLVPTGVESSPCVTSARWKHEQCFHSRGLVSEGKKWLAATPVPVHTRKKFQGSLTVQNLDRSEQSQQHSSEKKVCSTKLESLPSKMR